MMGGEVVLIDERSQPGGGVTGQSFGWINVINGTPGDRAYILWREAIEEYRRLKSVLPEALAEARKGSLLWKATPEQTEEFGNLHKLAGEDVTLLEGRAIAEMEPCLRRVPELAVYSPRDLAVDPARLAAVFVSAAVTAGASARLGGKVASVETCNGRVTGVKFADDVIKADVVVLAAGASISTLTGELGIDTGIAVSPALLLRYFCSAPFISHILRSPQLEVRQAGNNMLMVAKSYVDDGDVNGPSTIGKRMLEVIRDELDLPGDTAMATATIGGRPTFPDGMPRVGFLPQMTGLYIAGGHPGVILAPLIGRLAAEEILTGKRTALIPTPL
ncbi:MULTISPECIES: FAD-binding oxidoreductase [unclassified Rhizobium]|nr:MULTISPECIES: FAD-binding oxidoreductase [unclassified Rhizobium]